MGMIRLPMLIVLVPFFHSFQIKSQQSANTSRLSSKKTIPKDSLDNDPFFISIGSEYESQVAFWGRTFDERQFGILPYVYLNSGKGFHAYVMNSYWSQSYRKPARTIAGIGFEYELTKQISFFAGYERWFNHYGDDYFNHALENEVEIGTSINVKHFTLGSVFYYMFGLEHIKQLDISVERKFTKAFDNIKVSIKPASVASLATPIFAFIYYENPDPDYDYEKFKWVDFESSLSLDIEWGNLELNGALRYNYPINIGNENLSSFLYFTADLNYSF